MIPKKPAPDLIRGGRKKIMLKQEIEWDDDPKRIILLDTVRFGTELGSRGRIAGFGPRLELLSFEEAGGFKAKWKKSR
jgi:hypothetical protein